MKMFKMPAFIKPEINDPLYYVHLVILATVALGILQLWFGGSMFTWQNILVSVPILLVGDLVAHTILQLR